MLDSTHGWRSVAVEVAVASEFKTLKKKTSAETSLLLERFLIFLKVHSEEF